MSNAAYITRSAVWPAEPAPPSRTIRSRRSWDSVGEQSVAARRLVQRSNGIRRRYYVIDPATESRTTRTLASPHRGQGIGKSGTGGDSEYSMIWRAWFAGLEPRSADAQSRSHGPRQLGAPVCEAVADRGRVPFGRHGSQVRLDVGRLRPHTATPWSPARKSPRWSARAELRVSGPTACGLGKRFRARVRKGFLALMLSDGAGLLLSLTAARTQSTRRLDRHFFYAHELPACMYMGAKTVRRQLGGWMGYSALERERIRFLL